MAQSANEKCLVVLANKERVKIGLAPLALNAKLYEAARFHSQDLADHGGNCDLHNSCNGEFWSKRVTRYYPNWIALGENVATSIDNPQVIHDGWMASSGHRANILNPAFKEMGAAIVLGQTGFGKLAFATEDFGSTGQTVIPTDLDCDGIVVIPPTSSTLTVNQNDSQNTNIFKKMFSMICAPEKKCRVHVNISKISGNSKKKFDRRVLSEAKPVFTFNRRADGGSSFHISIDGVDAKGGALNVHFLNGGADFVVPSP